MEDESSLRKLSVIHKIESFGFASSTNQLLVKVIGRFKLPSKLIYLNCLVDWLNEEHDQLPSSAIKALPIDSQCLSKTHSTDQQNDLSPPSKFQNLLSDLRSSQRLHSHPIFIKEKYINITLNTIKSQSGELLFLYSKYPNIINNVQPFDRLYTLKQSV